MKILHTVQMYDPDVGGMQEVVRQLSERLAARGHEVTIATSTHPGRARLTFLPRITIREFAVSGNMVRGIQGDIAGYERFLVDAEFDVVVNFAAQIWTTDLALPLLPKIRGKKVFVPTGFSCLHVPAFHDYYEKMPAWLQAYDSCIYLSETYQDLQFARRHHLTNSIVIPNGADEREFLSAPAPEATARLPWRPDELAVLLVGSHTSIKGHAEAIAMFRQAAIPDSTLLIVGNCFGIRGCAIPCTIRRLWYSLANRFSNRRVLFRHFTRAETLAAFRRADIFLFPSNLECSPIVLFESLASRTPFLASDAGNSVEIAALSGGGEIIPTRKDERGYSHADIVAGATMLRALAKDAPRRQAMAEQGFTAWQEKFTWQVIAGTYETLYQKLQTG
jgi:glycosyltransferase involved in cell wall biosynthesis